MFHEDRELITKLKGTNAHFTSLFDKHNDLDEKIAEMQKGNFYNDAEIYAFLAEYKKENNLWLVRGGRFAPPFSTSNSLKFSSLIVVNRAKFNSKPSRKTLNFVFQIYDATTSKSFWVPKKPPYQRIK